MTITINFDPTDIHDVGKALAVAAHVQGQELAALLNSLGGSGGGTGTAPVGDVLEQRCRQMLDPKTYGPTRLGLVRIIAEASPGEVSKDDLYAAAKAIDETKNSGKVVGGLHGNLEQIWRGLGGSDTFVTTTETGFRMRPELAAVVLAVLDGN